MTSVKNEIPRVGGILTVVLAASVAAAACGGGDGAPRSAPVSAAGPAAIDVVRVVEKLLDVPLSLPGELTAFQSVAMFPRVTGFVKTVDVDRGSSDVRAVRTCQVGDSGRDLGRFRIAAHSREAGDHLGVRPVGGVGVRVGGTGAPD